MDAAIGVAAGTAVSRRYSCAATSQAQGEPVLGTASTTSGYLLVEEPGPWGAGGVPSSRLGESATAALRSVAAAGSSKLLLVRRPVRQRPEPAERTLFKVTCSRGAESVLSRTCAPGDVVAAAADDDGWQPSDEPLLLVCTHGRKDWDCAHRGRPLAAAIAEHAPEATWESSHVGGCRFAANALALPTGHAYGRVDADDAAELVAAVRERRVVPRLLRGRSTDPMLVQAADVHARSALGRDAADDLVPLSADPLDEAGGRWRVVLADSAAAGGPAAGGRVVVELRLGHVGRAQRLTCSAAQEQYARTWELVDLRVDPPPPSP